MAKLDLVLDAKRSAWALSASHGTEHDRSSRTQALYDKILKRDDHVCQGCGWRAQRYQEIHPIDGDHRNADPDNWVTVCPLCHQVFHLPQASGVGGGKLIWLPEISQAHLNLLSIPMFVAWRNPRHPFHGVATTLRSALSNRAAYFQSRFHQDDPMLLAQVIVKLPPDQYERRCEMLKHIRLWPQPERFEEAIDHWEETVFNQWQAADWAKALPESFDLSAVMPKEPTYG